MPHPLTRETLCTQCQQAPRLPKQRWCRSCLTQRQRQRRAARAVTRAAAAEPPRVTQTPVPLHTAPPASDSHADPGADTTPRRQAVDPLYHCRLAGQHTRGDAGRCVYCGAKL
jgi:hypothetical protein